MIVTFDEYSKKEKETNDYKVKILKVIDDFINTDTEFLKNHLIREPYKGSTDFYFDDLRGGGFVVNFRDNWSTDTVEFTGNEYKRLLEFMKNPELYKTSKKYNL
jgi:hypothetical protein